MKRGTWLLVCSAASAVATIAPVAHATSTTRESIELLLPDCTEPAGDAWPRGVPPTFVFVRKTCSTPPGGPSTCQVIDRLGGPPREYTRDEPDDPDGGDLALWPRDADVPLIGTFEDSGARCFGAPLYVFSSPLEPGDYELRAPGGQWIHVADAGGDLPDAPRATPDDRPAPRAVRASAVRSLACPRGAPMRIDDQTRTAACTRADGTRDGVWITWYPDGAVMAAGATAGGRAVGRFLVRWPGGGTFVLGHYDGGAPSSGWRVRNAHGHVIGEGAYARGARDGRWQVWNADGTRAGEASYRDGAPDGAMSRSDAQGQRRVRGAFADGARTGTWETWYSNGRLARREEMRDGVGNGPAIAWNRDGDVIAEGAEKNGMRDGPWRERGDVWLHLPDQAGDVTITDATKLSEYRGDTATGAWSAAYPDGARAVEIGAPVGGRSPVSIWYPDGKRRAEGSYERGEPAGHWTVWRDDDQLALEGDFGGNGVRHIVRYRANGHKEAEGDMWLIYPAGHWVMYFDDGTKQEEGDYAQPKPDVVPAKDGVWRGYHRNGRVYYEAQWKLGREIGVEKIYWETGALLGTSTYVDGREVERVLYEKDGVTVRETRHY